MRKKSLETIYENIQNPIRFLGKAYTSQGAGQDELHGISREEVARLEQEFDRLLDAPGGEKFCILSDETESSDEKFRSLVGQATQHLPPSNDYVYYKYPNTEIYVANDTEQDILYLFGK